MGDPSDIRILITGGAGFVGTSILHYLLDAHPEWTVIVSDIVPSTSYKPPPRLDSTSKIEYVELDVTSAESCARAIKTSAPTVIIHTAGVVPGGFNRYTQTMRAATFRLNVDGTANMLQAAKQAGVRYFVHTSSCCVIIDDLDHDFPNYPETLPYPRHTLIYGESKARAEQLVLAAHDPASNFFVLALRPSVILGEADYQLVPSIAACIDKLETPYCIGPDHNYYDFTYVGNVAHAHLLAVRNLLRFHHFPSTAAADAAGVTSGEASAAGLPVNISNDEPVTFRDFCLAVWAECGHVPPFQLRIPLGLAFVAGALAELWGYLVGGRTTLCRGSVKDAYGARYADLTRSKRLLGFHPVVSLQEGIRRSVAAMKERQALGKANGTAAAKAKAT